MNFTKETAIHYGFIFFLVAKSSTDNTKILNTGVHKSLAPARLGD
jgi:hypothetical protein